MLNFRKPTLDDKADVDAFLYRWGEGSCQHSFVAMFCTEGKYNDQICFDEDYLFVLRKGLCSVGKRVYLFPMGNIADEASLKNAVEKVISDAHAHGAAVSFDTVTERAKELILRLFPGRFDAWEKREYAEYLYTWQKLALLPGREMASKRHDLNTLMRDYGDKLTVEELRPADIQAVRAFQQQWLSEREEDDSSVQLAFENTCIEKGLAHFEELGLSGIVVRYDGKICGYAYGAPLSDTHYDVIIEKGDRRIVDIYRLLNRDLVKMCCGQYAFINREEDLGVEGLRKAKLSYKPDMLLNKYLVKEVETVE